MFLCLTDFFKTGLSSLRFKQATPVTCYRDCLKIWKASASVWPPELLVVLNLLQDKIISKTIHEPWPTGIVMSFKFSLVLIQSKTLVQSYMCQLFGRSVFFPDFVPGLGKFRHKANCQHRYKLWLSRQFSIDISVKNQPGKGESL